MGGGGRLRLTLKKKGGGGGGKCMYVADDELPLIHWGISYIPMRETPSSIS